MTRFSRRSIIALCIALVALLGVGAQLHGLSHALKALQSSTHDEALATQALACELCLQFAAADGLAPVAAATLPAPPDGRMALPALPATLPRAVAFVAYAARAPPTVA